MSCWHLVGGYRCGAVGLGTDQGFREDPCLGTVATDKISQWASCRPDVNHPHCEQDVIKLQPCQKAGLDPNLGLVAKSSSL